MFTEWLLVAGYVSLVWRWNQLLGGKVAVAGFMKILLISVHSSRNAGDQVLARISLQQL